MNEILIREDLAKNTLSAANVFLAEYANLLNNTVESDKKVINILQVKDNLDFLGKKYTQPAE